MTINNFSALIQLAATLSIAFVAVEYVRSYTAVICEKFFKFHDFIKVSFDECRSILTDKDTLSHIQPIDIGGGNTNSEIEAVKRTNEALTKEIDTEENNKKEEINCVCQAKSMSSMCFFIFLYSTLLLFIGGIEEVHTNFSRSFVLLFSILGILYLLFGWYHGEKENPAWYCDFASLRHPIIAFIVIFLFAIILNFVNYYYLDNLYIFCYNSPSWWYSLVFSILLTYANFIIFVFKIRNKAKVFKRTVLKSKNELKDKCQDAEKSVADLMATMRVVSKIQSD